MRYLPGIPANNGNPDRFDYAQLHEAEGTSWHEAYVADGHWRRRVMPHTVSQVTLDYRGKWLALYVLEFEF